MPKSYSETGYEMESASSSRRDKKTSNHTSGGSSHGSSSKTKKEPRRHELMVFWKCCHCGEKWMTKGTNKVCTNVQCQMELCDNCPRKEKVIVRPQN